MTATTADPRLARHIEVRTAKLSHFADVDVMKTPGRLRKPFGQKTWRSLSADIRLTHLRATVAKQVEEEHAARLAVATKPKPKPKPVAAPAAVRAPAPTPAPLAVARYATRCHVCDVVLMVHTPNSRVTYCADHTPRHTRKSEDDV